MMERIQEDVNVKKKENSQLQSSLYSFQDQIKFLQKRLKEAKDLSPYRTFKFPVNLNKKDLKVKVLGERIGQRLLKNLKYVICRGLKEQKNIANFVLFLQETVYDDGNENFLVGFKKKQKKSLQYNSYYSYPRNDKNEVTITFLVGKDEYEFHFTRLQTTHLLIEKRN